MLNSARLFRIPTFLTLLGATFFLAAASVSAQENSTPVGAHMKAINQNLRQFRSQAENAGLKSENLKLVDTIIEHAEAARELEPALTADIPADQRADFLKAFRETMDELIGGLGNLRKAVDQGDAAGIRASLQKLDEIKKSGHGRFQKED